MKRKQIIIIIIVLLIVVILIYLLIPKSYLKFTTSPQQADIIIDNSPKGSIKNGEIKIINPGHHKITISRDEFSTYTKDIDININETKEILVILDAYTNNAKNILNTPEDQRIREANYRKETEEGAKLIEKEYPILKILPYYSHSYNIKSCDSKKYPNNKSKIAICIKVIDPNTKKFALKFITDKGYIPNDYEIIWNEDYFQGQ